MKKIIKSPLISINVHDKKIHQHAMVDVKGRPFYALTYRKSGTAKIHIGETLIVSKGNHITLTPKNQDYKTEVTEDTHIIAVHFDCLDDAAFQLPFVFKAESPHILTLFENILKKYSADDSLNFECFSLFYEILAEVEKHFKSKEETKFNPKILQAKTKIEKNYMDSNLNINTLADSLSISVSYLRQEFKKVYSVTPIFYLKKIRLQNAISMLESDYYSIYDIAKKCGYCSTSYFIQDFHKSMGYSPLKYKEKYFNFKN